MKITSLQSYIIVFAPQLSYIQLISSIETLSPLISLLIPNVMLKYVTLAWPESCHLNPNQKRRLRKSGRSNIRSCRNLTRMKKDNPVNNNLSTMQPSYWTTTGKIGRKPDRSVSFLKQLPQDGTEHRKLYCQIIIITKLLTCGVSDAYWLR